MGRGWYFSLCVILSQGILLSQGKRYHSIAGPYRVNIKHVEPCPNTKKLTNGGFEINFKEVHLQRRQVLTYDLNITTRGFDYDKSLGAVLSLASWNSVSGWRENAHNFRIDNVCLVYEQYFRTVWSKLMDLMFGEWVGCPYVAGIYRAYNFTVTMKDIPMVKHFFYGKFRADLNVYHGLKTSKPQPRGCFRAYVDTEPV